MTSRSLWPLVLLYVALRLLLTVGIAAALLGLSALLGLGMPLLVAAMLAIILQLPLSWLVFGSLRERVTSAAAASAGRRRRLRSDLRDALAGDPRGDGPAVRPTDPATGPQDER